MSCRALRFTRTATRCSPPAAGGSSSCGGCGAARPPPAVLAMARCGTRAHATRRLAAWWRPGARRGSGLCGSLRMGGTREHRLERRPMHYWGSRRSWLRAPRPRRLRLLRTTSGFFCSTRAAAASGYWTPRPGPEASPTWLGRTMGNGWRTWWPHRHAPPASGRCTCAPAGASISPTESSGTLRRRGTRMAAFWPSCRPAAFGRWRTRSFGGCTSRGPSGRTTCG
mmetsp:Transcript_27818/g.89899  ORF Transcript_27818/g.89899 Transcript_27818/m.89899 type:complete len:225 (+) Transcript_27818:536-1210(+)